MTTSDKQLDAGHEQIAVCAYFIWEKEGKPAGMEARHWDEAEMQLRICGLHDHATKHTKGTSHGNDGLDDS
jgi:hypothetical protein